MNRIWQMLDPYICIYKYLSLDICICAGISRYIHLPAVQESAAMAKEFKPQFCDLPLSRPVVLLLFLSSFASFASSALRALAFCFSLAVQREP